MYKRPTQRLVVSIPKDLKFAPIENSMVYALCRAVPYPPFEPKPYVPIGLVEDIVSHMKRNGASEEEIQQIRLKNHYVAAPVVVKPVKRVKKKKAGAEDLDKVFSQFATKPAVKKKVLRAVIKKI